MQINIHTQSFTRLTLKGKLVGEDAIVLKTMLDAQIESLEKLGGVPMLVLDLAEATAMDSAGLGVLITTCTQLRNLHGRVYLLNVNRGIRRLLIRANVASVFEFPKTLEAALTDPL